MPEVKFEYDDNEFKELLGKIPEIFGLGWKYIATDFWGNIRREAPVDHGRLAGSFNMEQTDSLVYHIKSGVSYAMAVYSGTAVRGDTSLGASGQPYDIFPVNREALWWPGLPHPIKAVYNHPGMKSNPYVNRAQDSTLKRVDDFMGRALREMGVK